MLCSPDEQGFKVTALVTKVVTDIEVFINEGPDVLVMRINIQAFIIIVTLFAHEIGTFEMHRLENHSI